MLIFKGLPESGTEKLSNVTTWINYLNRACLSALYRTSLKVHFSDTRQRIKGEPCLLGRGQARKAGRPSPLEVMIEAGDLSVERPRRYDIRAFLLRGEAM